MPYIVNTSAVSVKYSLGTYDPELMAEAKAANLTTSVYLERFLVPRYVQKERLVGEGGAIENRTREVGRKECSNGDRGDAGGSTFFCPDAQELKLEGTDGFDAHLGKNYSEFQLQIGLC